MNNDVFINKVANEVRKFSKEGDSAQAWVNYSVREQVGGGLLLLPRKGRALLYRFEGLDFIEKHVDPPFAVVSERALGSGQREAEVFLHFLRSMLWAGGRPSLEVAILCTIWSIRHAIDTNPGGVGVRPEIAVLRTGEASAAILEAEKVEEYEKFISELKKAMGTTASERISHRTDEKIPPGGEPGPGTTEPRLALS